ncbi:MAG: hypothetical protein V1855_03015 [bacterium]
MNNIFKKIIQKISPQRSHFEKKLTNFLKTNIPSKKNSPTILFWEPGGFASILEKNAIFSLALNTRGYNTHFIICDGTPQACMQRGIEQHEKFTDWPIRCKNCTNSMIFIANKYKLRYSFFCDYITQEKKQDFECLSHSIKPQEIQAYILHGINVGQNALNMFNRYLKGYSVYLSALTHSEDKILRKCFFASLVNTHITHQAIEKHKPYGIFTSHGVYDYAPPIMLGFQKGIKTMCWDTGYADFFHYFSVPKNSEKLELRSITQQAWEQRKNNPLTEHENQQLDTFINERYINRKARDIAILSNPEDATQLKEKLDFFNNKKTACLFTHVNWDACFDLSSMLFSNANQWLMQSLQKMISIPDINWIIRIHPGELSGGSLFKADDFLRNNYENIPSHIKILWSDSPINSYSLYKLIDVGITILGTVGTELPLLGKPIITAGTSHFSKKGFSFDPDTKEEYFSLLENIKDIKPLTPEQINLARQYAYSYFIQRQIPLHAIDKKRGHWGGLDIDNLNLLLPGNDPILDKICEGIIQGKDVILDNKTLRI